MSTPPTKSQVRHKVFHYRTGLRWIENRIGTATSEGKPELAVASPPEFHGEPGVWTPEDLFVAALDSCLMTTFLALADRKSVGVVSYESDAEGTLEFRDGEFLFTGVVLRPKITVSSDVDPVEARRLIDMAHGKCLIANSVRSELHLEPSIEVEESS